MGIRFKSRGLKFRSSLKTRKGFRRFSRKRNISFSPRNNGGYYHYKYSYKYRNFNNGRKKYFKRRFRVKITKKLDKELSNYFKKGEKNTEEKKK